MPIILSSTVFTSPGPRLKLESDRKRISFIVATFKLKLSEVSPVFSIVNDVVFEAPSAMFSFTVAGLILKLFVLSVGSASTAIPPPPPPPPLLALLLLALSAGAAGTEHAELLHKLLQQ